MHSSDPPGLVIELLGPSHRPRSPPDGAQLPSFDRRPVIRRRPRARAPLQTLELGRYLIESGGETAADRIHGGDARDGDGRSDKAILDRGRSTLVFH